MGEPRLPRPSTSTFGANYLSDPPRDHPPSPTSALQAPPHHDDLSEQSAVPAVEKRASERPPQLSLLDTLSASSLPVLHVRPPSANTPIRSPHAAALHLQTDLSHTAVAVTGQTPNMPDPTEEDLTTSEPLPMTVPVHVPGHTLRSNLSAKSIRSQYSLSPGSAISSPALAAMTDITPLPSPLLPGDSPGPWKRPGGPRPDSTGSLGGVRDGTQIEDFCAPQPESTSSQQSSVKKKAYSSLMPSAVEANGINQKTRKHDASHVRHRSLSEFVPGPVHNVRQRNTTLSSIGSSEVHNATQESSMHREEYLAEQRGLVSVTLPPPANPTNAFPTPPPSNRSVTESESEDQSPREVPSFETMKVKDHKTGRLLRYRPVRPLGQGTFSKVVLATSESLLPTFVLNETSEPLLNPKHLVAIKIVEHGPAGGADEERVELSLKREVEILQSISHPSLVNLMAFDYSDAEALLVLGYCPGGDLFDVASQHQESLTEPVVQRFFAELVGAVQYLHSKWIVHRDIKLENVLLNVPPSALSMISFPQTHPKALITLTDLGLSRQLPQPPASPLLTTRCGSEDYAAPEILLSQPYDGRSTDAWALGVLLYALMEGRLPFDPPPPRPGSRVARGRSRAAHRIARCEWIWSRFGDDDGDWDSTKGIGWEGAKVIVEGLLRKVSRGRCSLDDVAKNEWVIQGIQVEGGLKRIDDEDGAVYTDR